MKYVVSLFLVLLAMQPPALQGCAMDGEKTASHHAAMQDNHDSECCQGQPADSGSACDETAQCAFLSVSFLVIPGAADWITAAPAHHYVRLDGKRYSGPPAPPLFRPPIA